MHPQEREFLVLVLRYLDLQRVADLTSEQASELQALEGKLRTDAPANGPAYEERRVHRRMATQIPGGARKDGVCGPCTILDIGAGGLRISNRGGIEVQRGDRVTISLRPEDNGLRIDIPARVCHVVPDSDRVGLAFCGAPVVSHVRAGGTSHGDRYDTRETPLARAYLCARNIAA